MAIPVYLQSFKAAGIYRVVFDKSTIAGVDSEILRLVVGYSEKGPFNAPTYISSVSQFKSVYGDISKKLEKRGVYFHRMAIQALAAGPILCLNLKKFDTEAVDGAIINTDFNPSFDPIDTVKLSVEDIYDTTRFWTLSADRLDNLKSVGGSIMDQYIGLCTTDTKNNSATYFIRKANGSKVNGYNITINDWYSDGSAELPEYLETYKQSLVSDFMAEIYVFKGSFSASQVLASSTLKNYFEIVSENGKAKVGEDGQPILKLKANVTNAFGDSVDTLDALYNDETSGAIGHYVGTLIPNFKSKQGSYLSLDILFNNDIDTHHMMMYFNTDLLDEDGSAHIDISGRLSVSTKKDSSSDECLCLPCLFAGTAKTTVLGNKKAPVVTDTLTFTNNVVKYDESGACLPIAGLDTSNRRITGTLVVDSIVSDASGNRITLSQVGEFDKDGKLSTVTIDCSNAQDVYGIAYKLGAAYVVSTPVSDEAYTVANDGTYTYYALYTQGYGTRWSSTDTQPFIQYNADTKVGEYNGVGPEKVITSIARLEAIDVVSFSKYTDADMNMKVSKLDVAVSTTSNYNGETAISGGADTTAVYGTSISFIPVNTEVWKGIDEEVTIDGTPAMYCNQIYDKSLYSLLNVGDCFLAADGTTDRDLDGEADAEDGFYDNVYVQDVYTETDENGNITRYIVKMSGTPLVYDTADASYLVRVDAPLNQELGTMVPQYLEGYVYTHDKPEGVDMWNKLKWQEFILSALTEYKGLRTGLLNKSDIDYRYIVDTFESYVDEGCKDVLSYLAKEKQSAFAFLNFPSVKSFIKCPYTSFTDAKGVFNVDYIAKGYNKKKAAAVKFSLPTDANGASFCAFYSPLKFTDGYVDAVVPSAALVSNLFMQKYTSRQPYYIVAGPNFGKITAAGLVGPDYNYSMDELQIIEPFGVNCMVYRPSFGTFINANQTAKQTPVSALSKVNVRELVIYLQDEVEKVLQAYQWEFNNPTTRAAILDKANNICSRIASNGGIQAYLNVMDSSNNTNEILDNEMAILSTHIEPGMGCGKMVHELTLYRTGQMSASITD